MSFRDFRKFIQFFLDIQLLLKYFVMKIKNNHNTNLFELVVQEHEILYNIIIVIVRQIFENIYIDMSKINIVIFDDVFNVIRI